MNIDGSGLPDHLLQDATFSIDDTAILRPKANMNTVKDINLQGDYFLSQFSRHYRGADGKMTTEVIAWMDEVRSPATKDKPWVVHQITGAPFDNKRRLPYPTPYPHSK